MNSVAGEPAHVPRNYVAGTVIDKGLALCEKAMKGSLGVWQFAAYNSYAGLRGQTFPALEAMVQMQNVYRKALTEAVSGDGDLIGFFHDMNDRLNSGRRYAKIVNTVGKQFFGSATFPGEQVIGRHGFFKLSYLPPKGKAKPLAVFHSGGAIPYGDGIFRLTQEYNLLGRFVERGMPVYAMELIGDRFENNYAKLTMDELVDSIAQLSEVAFEHNNNMKMAFEGYCGNGTQGLAYLAGRPGDADRKFRSFCTFVAPIDGTRCPRLAESIQATPSWMMDSQLAIWDRLGQFVPGDALRLGLDSSLGANYYKSALGYFTTGWLQRDIGKIGRREPYTATEIRELAGAYWISPDSARRFPVPVDMVRFTTALFTTGISPKGDIDFAYRGTPLSLQRVVDETNIHLYGFYGALDEVIPDRTANVLTAVFGDRYTHVVHPGAGHISYVLSPNSWKTDNPRGFKPNPVDLLLGDAKKANGK